MRSGDFNLEGFPHEDYTVRRKIVHEDYAEAPETGYVNDIALLELTEPVILKEHIMPICLPESHADFSNVNATATGWDISIFDLPPLPFESLPPLVTRAAHVIGSESCGALLETVDEGSGTSPSSLCVRLDRIVEAYLDPVYGDSGFYRAGAPTILRRYGRYQVIGLASGRQTIEGRKFATPSFFTNVAAYVEWINLKVMAGSESKVSQIPAA